MGEVSHPLVKDSRKQDYSSPQAALTELSQVEQIQVEQNHLSPLWSRSPLT